MSLKCHQAYELPDPRLESWMKEIDDEALIRQIAIPGSHDACTAGIMWATETQVLGIPDLLKAGSRYFDVRVHKKGDKYVIFHSICDGRNFLPVLAELKDFIKSHPTETLILDFQHFKGDSQEDVYGFITKELQSEGLVVENKTGESNLDFIRGLKLKDARGKCIVFWGDRSFRASTYLFPRNDNECTYDDMCMDSYYIGSLHKEDPMCLINKAHPIYFDRVRKLKEQGKNGVFVLQCQLTDKMYLRGPWSRERINDEPMSQYIRDMKDSDMLEDINIVLRDFINPRKCEEIIKLNEYKKK